LEEKNKELERIPMNKRMDKKGEFMRSEVAILIASIGKLENRLKKMQITVQRILEEKGADGVWRFKARAMPFKKPEIPEIGKVVELSPYVVSKDFAQKDNYVVTAKKGNNITVKKLSSNEAKEFASIRKRIKSLNTELERCVVNLRIAGAPTNRPIYSAPGTVDKSWIKLWDQIDLVNSELKKSNLKMDRFIAKKRNDSSEKYNVQQLPRGSDINNIKIGQPLLLKDSDVSVLKGDQRKLARR
jgi:hypothetical protein